MPNTRLILSLLVIGERGLVAGRAYWSEVIGLTLARTAVNGEGRTVNGER